jgi:hypothetical protein
VDNIEGHTKMANLIGVLAIVGLLAVWWVIHKAAAHMRDLSQGRSGPYSNVSTAELKRRHADLNRHFEILTHEQREEHDRVLHALLMRGETPR